MLSNYGIIVCRCRLYMPPCYICLPVYICLPKERNVSLVIESCVEVEIVELGCQDETIVVPSSSKSPLIKVCELERIRTSLTKPGPAQVVASLKFHETKFLKYAKDTIFKLLTISFLPTGNTKIHFRSLFTSYFHGEVSSI